MKIAIVHNLPPGGQKRALLEQVKRLSARHQLDLYTLSVTNEKDFSLHPYVTNHTKIDFRYKSRFPYNLWSIYIDLKGAYKKMAQKINSKDYDIVYVNPCYFTQSPYILRYLTKPTLYFCPEVKREFYEHIPREANKYTYLLTYPFRLPLKFIDQTNARFAAKIITNSSYSKNKIKMIYQKEADVNYLGIDTKIFRPLKIRKENAVITVGNLSLLKGYEFLINSLSLITAKIRPKLICAGGANRDKDYILKLAKHKKVEIRIYENIDDTELVKLYSKAKCFVYGAYNEPFGLALLEALACGLKIVAIDEGGVREILSDRKYGILTGRNEEEFSRAVAATFTSKMNFEAIQYVKDRWSWERSVKELEKYMSATL